jgi:hypothetical protein
MVAPPSRDMSGEGVGVLSYVCGRGVSIAEMADQLVGVRYRYATASIRTLLTTRAANKGTVESVRSRTRPAAMPQKSNDGE